MEKHRSQKIVILGCGNVAWHIARHLHSQKGCLIEVFNHRANKDLSPFKNQLKCKTNVGFDQLPEDADLYIITVADKAISKVARQINTRNPEAIVMHTSGSVSLNELGERVCGTAVFYPLQSFSKRDSVNWREVPIILEANRPSVSKRLEKFAHLFSQQVFVLKERERLKFHLAAVFANNFTNALYVAVSDLLGGSTSNDNFKILLPLIRQTSSKIEKLNPRLAQTGPAKRKDELVMKKHLRLLSKQPELRKIYKQLSKLIIKQQGK